MIDNMITEKDLIYLKELFYKNYYLYLELKEIEDNIKDKKIKEMITLIKNMHEDHMYYIISSLRKENIFGGEDE